MKKQTLSVEEFKKKLSQIEHDSRSALHRARQQYEELAFRASHEPVEPGSL